jgi:predicted RNA binding protein YcfA (HicA-like mRNA interferase family)
MLKSTEVLAMLRRHGFVAVRQSGSHVIMEHPDGRRTVVPLHRARDLPRGLLAQILKDVQLTIDQLTGS